MSSGNGKNKREKKKLKEQIALLNRYNHFSGLGETEKANAVLKEVKKRGYSISAVSAK